MNNFKSFKYVDIELNNFNVLIGPNASGKSNFIQIFDLIRNIPKHGLENAISILGGPEYLRNFNSIVSDDFSFEFIADSNIGFGGEIEGKLVGVKGKEVLYGLSICFNNDGNSFGISENKLIYHFDIMSLKRIDGNLKEDRKIDEGCVSFVIDANRELTESWDISDDINLSKFFNPMPLEDVIRLSPKKTLLELPLLMLPNFHERISSIGIYNFDPKLPKRAVTITGKVELEEDGSNLAIVLKNILNNNQKKRKLLNLLMSILPFVTDLSIEKIADKFLLLKLKETFSDEEYVPAALLSDGTVSILLLIMALYFEEKILSIIEEPERNIHPKLIPNFINMINDASSNKQFLITTHNPEIIKNVDIKNVLLVSRKKDGFSEIMSAKKSSILKTFLENDLGIDDIFVQDFLGV